MRTSKTGAKAVSGRDVTGNVRTDDRDVTGYARVSGRDVNANVRTADCDVINTVVNLYLA